MLGVVGNIDPDSVWSTIVDVGTICIALAGALGLLALLVKFPPVRWGWHLIDRDREERFAQRVGEVVTPIVEKIAEETRSQVSDIIETHTIEEARVGHAHVAELREVRDAVTIATRLAETAATRAEEALRITEQNNRQLARISSRLDIEGDDDGD